MSYSVNEIEALATKAARGAGAAPAQAAHFGRTTAHHIAASRPDDDLLAALNALPNGSIQTLPLPRDQLSTSFNETKNPLPVGTRLNPSENLLNELNMFAHRTYVPSSDASRTAGAGAGLNDND